MTTIYGIQRRGSGVAWIFALLAGAALVTACNTDRFLDIKAPSRVPVEVFDLPQNAALMVNSAIGDFECAIGYAMIGMSMCEAAFDLQAPVDQMAIFALAEQRFTTAITTGGASPEVVNAAYVGRARVRLFQGNKTGAATDAGLVPAGFVFNAG